MEVISFIIAYYSDTCVINIITWAYVPTQLSNACVKCKRDMFIKMTYTSLTVKVIASCTLTIYSMHLRTLNNLIWSTLYILLYALG